jgi:hypothetical protein
MIRKLFVHPVSLWILLGALVTLICGCVSNEQVRWVDRSGVEKSSADESQLNRDKSQYSSVETYRDDSIPKQSETKQQASYEPTSHTTAYIEFDEQGDFFDRRQLSAALDMFQPNDPKRLVIFYAHGWKNNSTSGDVVEFNKFLAHLDRALNGSGTLPEDRVKVFGVYLAWRGALLHPAVTALPQEDPDHKGSPKSENFAFGSLETGVKETTFWTRKAAAFRFAGAPLLETIQTISSFAKVAPAGNANFRAKVVLIGHSFGAYIIERSILQSLASANTFLDPVTHEGYIYPPADLVILLNSAAPAVYAKQLIDFFKWHQVGDKLVPTSQRASRPYIVSISSEGDWATGVTFPMGTALETPFSLGAYQDENSRTYAGAHERIFFTHTPGHTGYLPSYDAHPTDHSLSFSNASAVNPTIRDNDQWLIERNLHLNDSSVLPSERIGKLQFVAWDNPDFWKNPNEDPQPARVWNLDPINHDSENHPCQAYNDTAYWIIRVPKEIIYDHGDVWNPNCMSLLAAVYRESGIRGSKDPRTLIVRDQRNLKDNNFRMIKLTEYVNGLDATAAH